MAFTALLFAPDDSSDSRWINLWDDVWFQTPEQETETFNLPTEKEIELDLPFEIEPEDAAEAQGQASEGHPGWESYVIQRNDTLGAILKKISTDEEARRYLVTQKMNSYRKLRRGKLIEYKQGDGGQLVALRYKASPELHLSFLRDEAGGMNVSEGAPELAVKIEVKRAEITPDLNSLFAASDDVNVPDAIIQKMIDALETRVDFGRDIRLNDNFTVAYEVLHDQDGDYAGPGELLGIRFSNRGNDLVGLFNEKDGGYFSLEGESLQRAFLRSPLKFSRISSRYSLRRFHPVLKKWRAHRGVDFAAPTNTPVRASADGTIEFAGRKGGYGNLVIIKHFGVYQTYYGHLNKFARGIKRGTKVNQTQVIGYVGSTGLATGPHLHYEFRVKGKHVDPLSADVPTTRPNLEGEELLAFRNATSQVSSLLGLQSQSSEAAQPSRESAP